MRKYEMVEKGKQISVSRNEREEKGVQRAQMQPEPGIKNSEDDYGYEKNKRKPHRFQKKSIQECSFTM